MQTYLRPLLLFGAAALLIPAAQAAPAKKPAAKATSFQRILPLHWQPLDEPGSGGWMVGMRISPHDSQRMLVSGDMLGVGLSTDGGKSWQATYGFKSWEMGDITWHPTDPKTVWVGAASGPYVSHDGGLHWTEMREGMPPPQGFGNSAPVEKVIFDPKDDTHLLALGGSSRRWDMHTWDKTAMGAIWESHDSGGHWHKLTTLTGNSADPSPDAKPGVNIVSGGFGAGSSNIIYAGLDGHGVWVSEDGGKTWQPRTIGLPHPNVERVIPHPNDPNIVFVSLDNHRKSDKTIEPGGIYKSVDAGRHWVSISNGLKQNTGTDGNLVARYKGFAVCDKNPDVMYTNNWSYDTGVSYVTQDGGAHWVPTVTKGNFGHDEAPNAPKIFHLENSQPAGLGMTVFTVAPNNPKIAYGLSSDTMIGTQDGGKTWTDALSHHLPGAGDGWRGRGYTGWCAMNVRFNPYKLGQSSFQAMDAARIWLSDDGLQTWHRYLNQPAPWGGGMDTAFTPSGRIYATTGTFNFTGIGRSLDGGKTWRVLEAKADPNQPEVQEAKGLPDLYSGSASEGIYARPDAPQQVWAMLGGKLYASADGGDSWKVVFQSRGLHWLAADPKHPKRFYVSGDKNVYQTDDGLTFTPIGGPHQGGRITVDSLGRVLVAARTSDHGGLWRWDGKTWSRLSDDGDIAGLAVDPTDPNRLAYSTSQDPYKDYCDATGVWVSANGGKTWAQAVNGLGMLRGPALAFNPHDSAQLVFGTEGRGFFLTIWPKTYIPTGSKSYSSTDSDAQFPAIQTPDGATPLVVRNGDMTEGTDLPANWDQKWVGKGTIKGSRDATTFHSAPASLVSSTEGTDAEGNLYEVIDASPGTTFTFSGVVKTQGVKAQIAVQDFGGNYSAFGWQQAYFQNPDTDWTPFTKQMTVPEGTAHLALVLWVSGTGKAWLDDVKISDVKYPAGQP